MTKIDSAFRVRRFAFWPLLFMATLIFVYFFGLNIPLLGPDEPRYSQVAREMFERGDWVTPTLGGFNWFEKPALLYWLQIGSYFIFGVSEFSARVGSVLFGLGTVASLWILGRRSELTVSAGGKTLRTVVGQQQNFANWLALLAASSIGILVFSRGASFDIIVTFPMTAAMVCFYIFDARVQMSSSPNGPGKTLSAYAPLFGFYFFVGLALLAKGLIGAVFPFAIIAFYYLLSRRLPGKAFLFSLFWGGVVTLAVAATWYLPMYQRNGWQFIDEFFIQHHFQRYTSNKYLHPQPFYFFFWVLPLMTLPWLPFFFAGIWDLVRGVFQHRDAEPGNSALIRYSAAWLIVPLGFFSFSGSKLPGYILPSLPPALIIATFALMRFVSGKGVRVWAMRSVAIATFITVVALLIFAVPRFAESDSVKSLIEAANERGHTSEKVLNLYTISHNAEFYAAGRLVRDERGKQRQFNNTGELAQALKVEISGSALVIYPLKLQRHLFESSEVNAETIKDNGEYAVAYVTLKR